MSVDQSRDDGTAAQPPADEPSAGDRSQHCGEAARQPPATDHARRRWRERASAVDIDVETAWRRAVPVDAPQQVCDDARLYAPCDVVFRVQDGCITSTWTANYDSLGTDRLGQCDSCGNLERFDATNSTCRWCQDQPGIVEMENGVTVRFGGGE